MRNKWLIISSKEDEHANYIISKCNDLGLGERIIRLNTEDFIDNISYTANNRGIDVEIKDSGKKFTCDEIQTVWYRRPEKVKPEYSDDGVNKFITNQVQVFLHGLYYILHKEAFWVNDLAANLFAKNKIYQLYLAQKEGFDIPKFIISNRRDDVMDFFANSGTVCNKSLDLPSYLLNGIRHPYMTRIVENTEEIVNNFEMIEACPTFFEGYIKKEYDIRVVIMGDKLFPFAIYSQDNELSQVDVRGVDPARLKHELIELPEDIEIRVKSFVKRQNMFFSSMDLIKSTDGKYYFIENNCNGQWLWLEYLTGVPMSEYFIACCLNKPNY